ncbi:MAG: hypothetical protein ACP5FL_05625 [Thermoplasmatota archaeon]
MELGIDMKKVLVVALLLCCMAIQPAYGNPVPVSDQGGTPVVDGDTPVILQYENVTYVVDEEHQANVSAVYRLTNPTGTERNLSIMLPFEERMPDDLAIRQDNVSISYAMVPVNQSFSPAARFPCCIPANGTCKITATYSLWIAEVTHRVAMYRYECIYTAETGRHWNGSIAEARFTFKVAKDLYSHGLSGFVVTETTRYMVARATYHNWTADRDIEAVWYNINAFGKALLIIVPVVIIVAAVLVIRTVRKRHAR